jgi:prepilin-type N-terminal cleavage/methylation domain-containing protein
MRLDSKTQRGDTIIEVLISMTILGVVLATAYISTDRSLQYGINSQMRDQAVLIGQQQVELLKNADSAGKVADFHTAEFCINPDRTLRPVDSTTHTCSVGQYEVVDKWSGDPKKTFSVIVNWQNQNHTNQITLLFKASDSHNGS